MAIYQPAAPNIRTATNYVQTNYVQKPVAVPMKQFDCGIHSLTYEADRAGCPVCWHEREERRLKGAVQEITNKLRITTEKLAQVESWYDLSMAMREATPLLNDEDMAFLKITLYEWRNKKSLTMKTTHGARKKKRQPASPNGFVVVPRHGDPYGHLCSSVGGLAIADYYDEALNSYGSIQAMTLLVRALAQHLPGGQE